MRRLTVSVRCANNIGAAAGAIGIAAGLTGALFLVVELSRALADLLWLLATSWTH